MKKMFPFHIFLDYKLPPSYKSAEFFMLNILTLFLEIYRQISYNSVYINLPIT